VFCVAFEDDGANAAGLNIQPAEAARAAAIDTHSHWLIAVVLNTQLGVDALARGDCRERHR
jgi:hypothetical protein